MLFAFPPHMILSIVLTGTRQQFACVCKYAPRNADVCSAEIQVYAL